tara:strand:- start:34 stop:1329 length:1296 start_codon:yes stop_codon:yes gene_type:complete
MPIQQMFLGLGAAGDKYWYLLYGDYSANSELYEDLVLDSSDNIYVGGYADGGGGVGRDWIITKYDKEGAMQYQRSAFSNQSDEIRALNIDNSGNIYMYGKTDRQQFARLSTNQSLSYQKRNFYYSASDYGAENNGNTLYVASSGPKPGYVFSHNNTFGVYDGRSFSKGSGSGGNKNIAISDMAIDSSNNVICVGKGEDFPHPGGGGVDTNMALIIKFNSSLTEQWARTIGGSGNSAFFGVGTDSSDNIYAFGVDGTGGQKTLMVKYNSSGTIQWQRTLASPCTGGTFHSVTDSSGNSYVCGKQQNQHAWVAKINSSGGTVWCRTWESSGGSDEQEFKSIALDSKGNIIICGVHHPGNRIALLIKLPNDGSLTGTHGAFTYAAASPSNSTTSIGSITSVGLNFGSISDLMQGSLSMTLDTPSFPTPTVVDID